MTTNCENCERSEAIQKTLMPAPPLPPTFGTEYCKPISNSFTHKNNVFTKFKKPNTISERVKKNELSLHI